uniref:Obtusifoliol 14-alpha demethylase n=1 Tax=Aegilops tauschii TaxID=37682 RepID=M8BMF7_AEGTA
MDLTIGTMLLVLAIILITAIVIKIANARVTFDPVCTRPPPPVVNSIALLKLLPTLCTKGPEITMTYLYNKFGSVFTVSILWKRISFLVGPEVSGPFFQGSESEVSQGNFNEFTVPMFGQENGFAVDCSTRMDEIRFYIEALKPSQLRSHVDPMLREVESQERKRTLKVIVKLVAIILITAIVTKIANARVIFDPVCTRLPPPVVNNNALLKLLPTLCTKGPEVTMTYLYNKFGSVFTVSILWKRISFLVGPEFSGPFFQGSESEVSQGNFNEFTVPMFGQENGFAVDCSTRMDEIRFYIDSLKPSQLRSHVDPMLREVEDYFGKWGDVGVVDLKYEFNHILMLIASRCLLGKEVRGKIFGEFYTLFTEIDEGGVNLVSFMLPYIPIPVNRRSDRACIKLTEIVTEILRSRKICNRIEDDVLQKLMDSSAVVSTWTGACLLTHEKFLDAAINEQKEIMRTYGDKIDYNVLLEMETLHSCIREAGRMNPISFGLVGQAQKNIIVRTKEGVEYDIPKGDTLVNLVMLTHKLPHIYKDPKVYDPDRFRSGRDEDKVGGKFSYGTFGGGRHVCTGEAYAFMQIKIIWSHLLRNFELKLTSPFPKIDWSKYALEPKGKVMLCVNVVIHVG